MKHLITLVGILLTTHTHLGALTCTWMGTTNNDWHLATNWDTGTVPTSADDVIIDSGAPVVSTGNVGVCRDLDMGGFFSGLYISVGASFKIFGNLNYNGGSIVTSSSSYFIFAGSTLQTTGGYTPLTVHNIVIANNNGLLMGSNITAYLTLDLQSGPVYTNNYFFKTASISGYNSTRYVINGDNLGNPAIDGGLSLTVPAGGNTIFPIGPIPGSYNPVTLTNSIGPTETFTAYVTPSGPSQDAVQRTWIVTEETAGGNTVDLVLQWDQTHEGTAFNRAMSSVYRSDNGTILNFNGYMPQVGNPNNPGVSIWSKTLAGITFESAYWVINNETSVLPITLIAFKVIPINEKARITWLIDLYSNPDYFEVEKSRDALTFQTLQKIPAQDATLYQLETVLDPGLRYYRLKMVDLEGVVSYSSVLALEGKGMAMGSYRVYPNPLRSIAHLEIEDTRAGSAQLKLYSQNGQQVMAKQLVWEKGQLTQQFDLTASPPGVYFLNVKNSDGTEKTLRVIKE